MFAAKTADQLILAGALASATAGPVLRCQPHADGTGMVWAIDQALASGKEAPATRTWLLEVRLVLGGQVVWLADTAGLRETADIVEAEGVRRAERAAREADLRIHVIDGANPEPPAGPVEQQDIVVFNKADQRPSVLAPESALPVSAATGEGIEQLEFQIGDFISKRAASVEAPVITRARNVRLQSKSPSST